jgi:primosomal replication protein N
MADNNDTQNDKPTIPADQAPCGVPGYDLTAGEYAAIIQHHVTQGHFFLASHFMEAAKQAKALERIELAAQQFFNIQPM